MKAISLLLLLAACATHEDHMSSEARLQRHLQQCYLESDSLTNLKSGRIKFGLEMKSEGTVKTVKILESAFKDDRNLEACVTGIMKQAFMKPPIKDQDFEVIQSINFVPKKL